MSDETEQEIVVPHHTFGHREEEFGVRTTCLDDSQAAVRSLEELARTSQREAERLLGIPHRFQVTGKPVEELEELEFPLLNIHVV